MSLVASGATVSGPHGSLLLPTSLTAATGEVTLVMADPGPSCTALALALGGRLALDGGEIALDGDPSPRGLRSSVVIVDAPGVTEPEPGLPVDVVVGEELALAGLPARRHDIAAYLRRHDAQDMSGRRWEQVPADLQTACLLDIGSHRAGTRAVVLTSPDRRGGNPREWYARAAALAVRELVVVVLATHASAHLLGLDDAPTTFEAGVA